MPQPDANSTAREEQFREVLAIAVQTAAALVAGRVATHQIDGTRCGWVVLQEVGSVDERRQVFGGKVSGSARIETQYESVLLTNEGELLVETCFDKVLTHDGAVSFRELQQHELTPCTPEAIREFDYPRTDRGWRLERRASAEIRTRHTPRTYKREPLYSRLGGAVIEALRRLPRDTDRPTLTEIWWDWSRRETARLVVPQPPSPSPISNLKVILLVCALLAMIACCGVCLVVLAVIGR